MMYPLLSVSLVVWLFLRSVGRIFDNSLLNQEIVLFLWVSEDEACFVWCLASLVEVVCLFLNKVAQVVDFTLEEVTLGLFEFQTCNF